MFFHLGMSKIRPIELKFHAGYQEPALILMQVLDPSELLD
jgi:hypothetical protein